MFDRLNQVLRDPKSIKQIRLTITIVFIVLLPLVYFGYAENFDWKMLIGWEVGILGILSFISIWTGRVEAGSLSFDIEIDTNEELKDVLGENKEMVLDIHDVDLASDRLDEYNDKGQERANKELTKIILDRKKITRKNLARKGKDTVRIDKEISNLKEFGLVDATFVALRYEDITDKTSSVYGLKAKSKRSRGRYNPRTSGKKFAVIKSLFTYTSIGANAGVLFAIDDLKKVFTYYVMLIVLATFTWTWEFVSVKRKTAVHYLADREDIKEALTYIHLDAKVKTIEEEVCEKLNLE